MTLVLGEPNSSSKRRWQVLGNLIDKAKDARHAKCSKAWLPSVYLTLLQEKLVAHIALRHLPLEATDKRLGEEKTLFGCFDGFYIWNFGDAWHQGYGKAR